METEAHDELTEDIIHSIRSLKMNISRYFRSRIPHDNLTEAQFNTIYDLVREDGQTLSGLSKRMGLSHSTVSGIIDRLETKGLVERRKDSEDARCTRVFISDRTRGNVSDFMSHNKLPLLAAVETASTEEKLKIAEGLSILNRLVLENEDPAAYPTPDAEETP